MTAKKIDHKAIQQKIQKLPSICQDGKKAVAELLKELGYKEPKQSPPKEGEVWLCGQGNGYYLITRVHGGDVYFVSLGSNAYDLGRIPIPDFYSEFVAEQGDILAYKNIAEYTMLEHEE